MNVEKQISEAVLHFWRTREDQARRQGSQGRRDAGLRTAVTGGRQLDGFVAFIRDLLIEAGLTDDQVHVQRRRTILPGYFRPTKEWDIIAVANGTLLATVEFKSQVGPSFGNNFNNRTEEAIGSAHDLWTAYREGAFAGSQRPWLGYLMLLEDCAASNRSVSVEEPHFNVFEEFRDSSYAKRYELLCERLVRERLYDAACLILSTSGDGVKGRYSIPSKELGVAAFATSLDAHARAFVNYQQK